MTPGVRVYRLLLLTGAMALATVALGWLGVLFAAVAFAVIDHHRSVPAEAGASAALAWGMLLLINAVLPGTALLSLVGRAMGIPAVTLPALTILFPALLAWSGAVVAASVLEWAGRPRRSGEPSAVVGS